MAFIDAEDVGGSIYSARPPRAPIPAMLGRRVRGRLGGRAHLGGAARMLQNHPIFRKVRQTQVGWTPDPADQLPASNADQDTRSDTPSGAMPDWMAANMPGNDPTGMYGVTFGDPNSGQVSSSSPMEMFRVAAQRVMERGRGGKPQPGEDVRARLFERYTAAVPQQPALTSRRALQGYLQNPQRPQMRQPLLPLRRPLGVRRPY